MSDADEFAIRNLVAHIAHEADMGEDLDDYLACFTEDASWEMPGAPPVQGHAAIRAGAERRRVGGEAGPGTHTRHVITTQVVRVQGLRATSDAYWVFFANTDTTPSVRLVGHYRDWFRREPEGWRLERRVITVG